MNPIIPETIDNITPSPYPDRLPLDDAPVDGLPVVEAIELMVGELLEMRGYCTDEAKTRLLCGAYTNPFSHDSRTTAVIFNDIDRRNSSVDVGNTRT